jgi:dipeptidyl aminopeptidase/acylaminoacyl peptidase
MAGMQPEDVFRLRSAADPRVSPDGATVAYVVAWVDEASREPRSAIWAATADGSAEPRRLTFGPKRDATPRWSPDGRWLAFTSARDSDLAQLYVSPVDAPGEARRLTDLQEEVTAPVWAPDGSRLAFTARDHDGDDDLEDRVRPPRRIDRLQYRLDKEGWTVRRTHHVWIVGLEEGDGPRQLTSGDFEDLDPTWSPDGSRVAFVSARHDDWDLSTTSDVYVLPLSGGDPQRLTATEGAYARPSWSPEGSSIAAYFVPGAFDDPRHARVVVVDPASGERSVLTGTLDRNCLPYPPIREPLWDDDQLIFAIEDAGRVPLYRVPSDGSSPPSPVLEPDGWVTGYDLAAGTLVHTRTTPTLPSELFAGDQRLTDVSRSFRNEVSLSEPEPFVAVAPDGARIDAWVMRPIDFDEEQTYPTVLNIHGGPFTQYGQRFFDEFQVEAGAGSVVVYANPRGSSGYAEEWGRAIRGPVEGGPGWGSVDCDDLMAVVDEAVKRYRFIDADRLAVMGGSYGGYMTSWIVGHTDRFRCAISERAVNEMASEDGTSDLAGFFRGYVGATAWEAPEAYARISPLSYAAEMTTPLLILHSEEDLRCPINQGEQLFTVLRSMRRPVELVRFPAESHELTRSGSPTHRVQRFEIVLEFLDRHLRESASP